MTNLINTDELDAPSTNITATPISISPIQQPFNSSFFKDIKNNNSNNNNNKNSSKKKNKTSTSFEEQLLFDEDIESGIIEERDSLFNGAGGNNIKPSPTKVSYELVSNSNKFQSFDDIINNNEEAAVVGTYKINKKSSMGLLSTSSSSFVEKVTLKERIRYFANFVIHHIKTSTIMTWCRIGLIALFIMGICLAIFKFKIQNHLYILQDFVKKFGIPLGGLVYVGVFMLLIIFLIPVTIPTIIGGMIFKLWFGILFVWAGSILGGLAAFFLGRYVFRKRIAKKIEKNKKLVAVDSAIGQEGWKIVLLLRLVPLIPESVLNYALSVTKVKFLHYLVSSSIGMIPGCSFFVYIGSMITNMSEIGTQGARMGKGQIAMYVISGVFMVVAILFITIIVRRAVNKKLESDESKGILDEEEERNLISNDNLDDDNL